MEILHTQTTSKASILGPTVLTGSLSAEPEALNHEFENYKNQNDFYSRW